MSRYTTDLYSQLESETGQATGYRQSGSYSLATHAGRLEEMKRNASMAKVFNLRVDVVTPEEISERLPLINTEDVLGGIHIPTDGCGNAVDITQALSKGARAGGTRIFQDTKVTSIRHDGKRITGVSARRGDIAADYVVLCSGMWTRDLAASIGANVP